MNFGKFLWVANKNEQFTYNDLIYLKYLINYFNFMSLSSWGFGVYENKEIETRDQVLLTMYEGNLWIYIYINYINFYQFVQLLFHGIGRQNLLTDILRIN